MQLIGNFRPKKGIINSIINSVEIAIIRNDQLKYKLASMTDIAESKMDLTYKTVELAENYFDTKIYPQSFRINEKVIVEPNNDMKDAMRIPEYCMVLNGTYTGDRGAAIKYQEELLDIYKDILKLINQEITTD